jgi:glycosyltransferase involved in cell wall biosynthesis
MRIDFCLPIRDEEAILAKNLEKLIQYFHSAGFDFSWRLIGVLNNCHDESENILRDFQRRFPQEVVCLSESRGGKAAAIKKAWRLGEADILVFMDMDLAVALSDIPALVAPLIAQEADLVIGSRFAADSRVARPALRGFASVCHSLISRVILRHNISDPQCGFKALRSEVFLALDPLIVDDYWFFDTELIVFAHRRGFRIKEIPVVWRDTRSAEHASRIRLLSDSIVFLKNIWRLRQRLLRLK